MLKTNIGNYAKEQTNKKMWILAGCGDQGREKLKVGEECEEREREREREKRKK